MPILSGPLTKAESEVELVWSYDPAVKAPKGLEDSGWFPRSLAVSVGPDADVVAVRGLDEDEYARVRDVDGKHQQLLAVAKAATVAHNGQRSASKVGEFIAHYATRLPVVVDLLANTIEAITSGLGPEQHARAIHARVQASRSGGVTPPATKSAGPAKVRQGRGPRR